MAAYACVWLHMAAYGCIWLHMAPYGCIWLHMAAYGCIGLHMAAYGCIWVHMVAPSSLHPPPSVPTSYLLGPPSSSSSWYPGGANVPRGEAYGAEKLPNGDEGRKMCPRGSPHFPTLKMWTSPGPRKPVLRTKVAQSSSK